MTTRDVLLTPFSVIQWIASFIITFVLNFLIAYYSSEGAAQFCHSSRAFSSDPRIQLSFTFVFTSHLYSHTFPSQIPNVCSRTFLAPLAASWSPASSHRPFNCCCSTVGCKHGLTRSDAKTTFKSSTLRCWSRRAHVAPCLVCARLALLRALCSLQCRHF